MLKKYNNYKDMFEFVGKHIIEDKNFLAKIIVSRPDILFNDEFSCYDHFDVQLY